MLAVDALASEVRELSAELAGVRTALPWMTTEEGGPVNVGERPKVLSCARGAVDEWFRRVAGMAPPKPMRRKVPEKKEAARVDWSGVCGVGFM